MSIESIPAVIANGQSLSGVVDLGGKVLVAIQMPSAWTAAHLTFQASFDGTTFEELFVDGVLIAIAAAPAQFMNLSATRAAFFTGVRWLKIRSTVIGDPSSPVNQVDDRTLQLMARSVGCSVTVEC